MKFKILCVGNQWRGADDGSLFKAFSRAGHLIDIVDDKLFVPEEVTSRFSKIIKRAARKLFTDDFNKYLIRQSEILSPDFICVYKGTSMYASTLKQIKRKNIPVICVYPDVSFYDHGPNIPECIPLYDHIFSTKRFGMEDLKLKFHYSNTTFIRHCIDPDIHKPVHTDIGVVSHFACDASFIGSYSVKKEEIISRLLERQPLIEFNIWGSGWHRSGDQVVVNKWRKQPIIGDLYALAIQNSRINVAILSEAGKGSSSGDMITSRTFHIPGTGGFMLHERTDEFLELFSEGREAECFADADELAEKIKYYLDNDEKRKQIAIAGRNVVLANHTADHRAQEIISTLSAVGILS